MAASMPPMPRPVTTRQIDRSTRPVTVVAMIMPNDHHREASEDRRATTDLVGDAAEHDRADGHADQLHRQNDAERGAVDAPFRGDAGRREADREDVETVEGVQGDRDADHEHLQPAHGGLAMTSLGSLVIRREGITFSVEIEQHG